MPKLEEVSKQAVVKFFKRFRTYESDLEISNRNKTGQNRINKRRMCECIDPDLLEEIAEKLGIELNDRELNQKVVEYLENILKEESFDSQKLKLSEDLAKIMLNPKNEQAEARVLMFKKDLRRVLKENGMVPGEIFQDEVVFGNVVKMLLENGKSINPPEVRAWIKNLLEGKRGKMIASEFTAALEEKIAELEDVKMLSRLATSYGFATAQDNASNVQVPRFKPYERPSQQNISMKRKQDFNRRGSESVKRVSFDSSAKTNSITSQSKPNAKTDHKEVTCWGCNAQGHSLNMCSVITDKDERARIVADKLKASKSQSRNNTHKVKPYIDVVDISCRVSKKEEALTACVVKLDGIKCNVILDDGSDRSLISKQWLENFQNSYNRKVTIFPLEKTVDIVTVDPEKSIQTKSYVEMSITFKVYEDLNMKSRTFFVVEQDIGLPIIGHHELAEIGIDPLSTMERISFRPKDYFVEEDELKSIDDDGSQSLDLAIQQMLMRARNAGMPEFWWKKLCILVKEFSDVFRVELQNDPAANVTPMDVSFKDGAKDIVWTSYNLKYTQDELKWLKDHIEKLEKYGFVYRNPHARYASPALVVSKPGRPGEFRLCVDVKRPNSLVTATHWPMPHIDVVLRKLNKSTVFAKLDAFKGYWLFPVTEECGELYSIKTPFGVFTPRRIVQGSQEAVRYFQAGMEEALEIHSRDDLLLWVDDILSHADVPEKLLESLAYVFRCCRHRKIVLSAKKCELFLREVTWCGRTISSGGIGFDPAYVQGILELDLPKTVGDLQQFICSMNWVRSTIPHYNDKMAKLSDCLRDIVSKIGSNKKKVLDRRLLANYEEWSEDMINEFRNSKDLLKTSIISTHYDPAKRVCVFPDASDKHWGLFITQVPKEDLDLPFENQRHSPLLIMSGSFKSGSVNWHIKEKEAYPILVALEKARDLLRNPDGFSLFSDHKNLVYILDPERRQVLKHADDRLSRWALALMSFRFTVEHIVGNSNVVADMLSRWKIEYPQTVCGASFQPGLCSTIAKPDFVWPSLSQVGRLQGGLTEEDKVQHNLTPVIMDGYIVYVTQSKRIFVPDLENLRLRLCVIAHCGLSGHRSIENTFRSLKERFYWPKMFIDVKTFCKQCLHCAVADSRQVIPRPLGEQMHAEKRNQILHYDFMHVGLSQDGLSYVLVIKDDFTGFVDLTPCEIPNAEVVVKALLKWYSLFGIALVHVSDQGSHFKNVVVRELNRRLSTKHHFTLPYAPWSNGTVEVVVREIRKLLKVWVSEFRVSIRNWPDLLPLMTHVLNFSVSPRIGFPPALAFGGFTTNNNVDIIFSSQNFKQSGKNFETLSQSVDSLRKSLEELHKTVKDNNLKRSRGNYQMPRYCPNFDQGDYVMFATRHNMQGPSRKSMPRWTGPYRIVDMESDWDFIIEHLVSNEKFHAHSSRLKFYCDKDLDVTLDLKLQITHDEMRYKVNQILNHDFMEDEFKLLVSWQGFDKEDATWEPLVVLLEDVPELVKAYIYSIDNADKNKNALLAFC